MGRVCSIISFCAEEQSRQSERVADVLSRRHLLITYVQSRVVGFETIKKTYEEDEDFREI